MQRAFASLVFYGLYKDMFRRGIQERITHALIFDEAHRAAGLKLIPTMAKECRKYGISLVVASQEARDLREIEVFGEPREVLEKPQRGSADEHDRPRCLALVKGPHDEGLEVLAQSVQPAPGIIEPQRRVESTILHSSTPSSRGSQHSCQTCTARRIRGLPMRWE